MTVRLDPDFYWRLKRISVDMKVTFNECIVRLLEAGIEHLAK